MVHLYLVPWAGLSPLARCWGEIRGQAKRPWFAYLTLLFLQMKTIWGMWIYRDLTAGDTANYFVGACSWFEHFQVNIVWSPLYTAFYGSVLSVIPDIYLATVLHRILIVLAASTLLLAVLRRLLPAPLAWLTAAWWVMLRVNFNTMYEIHLFGLLPVLAVCLVVGWRDRPWCRGCALALLSLFCVLVRNELIIGTGLLAFLCLIWEATKVRGMATRPSAGAYLWGYLIPLVLAGGIVLCAYHRSQVKLDNLGAALWSKETLNMGQGYAFCYQQRHPEWALSPWTQYQSLMAEHFGKAQPTLREMIAVNPRAVLEHIAWNLQLTPNGLQVLLFQMTSGSVNPDHVHWPVCSRPALILTGAVAALWLAALYILVRDRSYWWPCWLRPRALTWLALLAVAATALVVIPTQRPRPSYLFPLGVLLMAGTGMGVFILLRTLRLDIRLAGAMPLVMTGVCLAAPRYYEAPPHRPPPMLRLLVQRLQPYQDVIAREKTVLLQGEFAGEVGLYLGRGKCKTHSYSQLDNWSADVPLASFLAERDVNLFYLDEALMQRLQACPAMAEPFLGTAGNATWQLIGLGEAPGQRWKLFRAAGSGSDRPSPH